MWSLLGSLVLAATLNIGDAAPPTLDVATPEGHRTTVDLSGQVTIIDFFTTWCSHCREGLAEYPALTAKLGGRVRVIVVDVEEPPAAVKAYFARHPLPEGVSLVLDMRGTAMAGFGPELFPSMFVLDQNGVVRSVLRGWGGGTADRLLKTASRLLDPPGGPRRGRAPGESANGTADARARRLGVEILH
jgi:thiol-disulfide isomerase/thioredoxin